MSRIVIPETTTYKCDMCGCLMKSYSEYLWQQVGFDIAFCDDCLDKFEKLMALYTNEQVIIRNIPQKNKPPLRQVGKTFYLMPFRIGV